MTRPPHARRAALVGCGDVSAVHLQAIAAHPEIELVGLCDTDPHALTAATQRWGVPGFTGLDEMLAATHPDVLHVTTPHDAHVDATLTALQAGTAVLQEKPLAHTLAEATRLVDGVTRLAQDAARRGAPAPRVGICLQNRYNVSSTVLKELLGSGRLGEVRGAYATVAWSRAEGYYPAKPWRGQLARSGGGLLMNQAPHTLDLIQWLLGPVTTVQGHVSTDKFGNVSEVEDTAVARFTHASGTTTCFYGTVNLSAHRPVEIEVDCERAYVRLADGLEVRWTDGHTEHWEERRAATSGRSYWGVSHEVLIDDFYRRLEDPELFWIGPSQALACLEMAQAVYAASRTGAPQHLTVPTEADDAVVPLP